MAQAIQGMALGEAVGSVRGSLSLYSDVYADMALSAVSLSVALNEGGPKAAAMSIAGLFVGALEVYLGKAIIDLAASVPVVSTFLAGFTAGWEWARARDAAREAAQIEWCQEDPWVRSGRYPEDFFKGWFGHVLEAFEEPDYEGNRLQRAIEARSDERPRPLTDNERRALRALREGVRRDTYAGGLSLWPVYLDAVVAARARTGYTLWRALSIKRAQYSDQSDRRWGGGDDGGGRPVYRTDERSWALAYARGEGSLYMDDMAAAAERFPPCDYLFGGRITQVSDFLADWEDRTHPRYPEEQARMVATAANLRAAAATAYNLARHDPRRLVVSALTPRVKVRPR